MIPPSNQSESCDLTEVELQGLIRDKLEQAQQLTTLLDSNGPAVAVALHIDHALEHLAQLKE